MTAVPPHLYLRISNTQLHFSRFSPTPPTYFKCAPYAMRHTTSVAGNLREARQMVPLLEAPITKTTVLVATPVTTVPLDLFQEEDCQPLYNYCFSKEQPHRVFYDVVPSAHTVLLFAVDETVCHTLEEVFGAIHFTASLTPVLRHFGNKSVEQGKQRIFIYKHESVIDVAIFEGKHLLCVNTFAIHTVTDISYYVFNLTKKLGLALAETPFYVVAPKNERAAIIATLQTYTPQVYPIRASSEFHRHLITQQENVPYDLVTLLLSGMLMGY